MPKPKEQKEVTLELPVYTALMMPKVPGGWSVVSIQVQGTKVLTQTVHCTSAPRAYATDVFKTVSMRKIFSPESPPILNLETVE